jgi:cytochrome c oxidase cbb3-type subunit I/II
MALEQFQYDNKIVKYFALATVIFGLVGMLVGLTAAIQLFYPIFNFDLPYTTFGRILPLHTNAVIYAIVGNAMFAGIY